MAQPLGSLGAFAPLRETPLRLSLRLALSMLAIGVCLLLMQAAARIGFSRLLSRYAVANNSLPAADEAVQLTPSDPNAHRARATVLNRLRRPADAELSLEMATSLRYRDDYLWLELGNTREELEDKLGALAAFDQAVRWAPYYAHTHWQRGNLKLRIGRYDEAFAELRQAAASNRKFLPSLIDLAWGLSHGSAKHTESLLQISIDKDRLEFIKFLARKGKGADVADQINLLDAPLSTENKDELARLLFAAKSFREPFQLWTSGPAQMSISNGGFEEPLSVSNSTFGWIVSERQAQAKLAIDVAEKQSGNKSLQVSFGGEWNAAMPLLSQIVLVQPEQRYRITFAVKTKELVTGGPPFISVTDVTSDQVLAKSETFTQSTNSWQFVNVDFTTSPKSEAVIIRLQRNNCAPAPCPIFGTVWLDEFSIRKL